MKKIKYVIIIIILIIVVIGVCCKCIYSNKNTTNNEEISYEGKEPKKVLENFVRKPMEIKEYEDFEGKIIGECLEPKEKIANDKSKKLLNYIQVSLDEEDEVNIVQKEGEEFNRLTKNNYQIDFDKNGEIASIKNYNDYSTVDKDKRDYKENDKLPEVEYLFDSREKIQPIMDDLHNILELDDYKLVSCSDGVVGSWSIVWNKVLQNDIVNPFDNVVVTLDSRDGSIWLLGQKKVNPDCNIKMIDSQKAIEASKPVMQKIGDYDSIDTELTVVRPNFFWEEGGPYQKPDFVRIAWIVSIKKTQSVKMERENDFEDFTYETRDYIYVDAETSEILGGDQSK